MKHETTQEREGRRLTKMRIAIVVPSFPAPSETFVISHVLGLIGAGAEVCVVTHQRPRGRLPEGIAAVKGRSLKVRRSPLSSERARAVVDGFRCVLRRPVSVLSLALRVARAGLGWRTAVKAFLLALPLEVEKAEIVHFEFSGVAGAYRSALPFLQAKIMVSCRGTAEKVKAFMDQKRRDDLMAVWRYAAAVHCVSADMQKTVRELGAQEKKTFVNRPALYLQEMARKRTYETKAGGPYRLLSVGRLSWEKGHVFGLLAVRELLNRGWDVTYEIVGEGPLDGGLRFAASQLGCASAVRFRGKLPHAEVRNAFEKCDVVVLPSLWEGISNVALESMAMEVPVVATNVGGMNEVIRNCLTGFLVPPYDALELATKLEILLKEPSLRREMGLRGRAVVEKEFSMERQVRIFLEKYHSLIGYSGGLQSSE